MDRNNISLASNDVGATSFFYTLERYQDVVVSIAKHRASGAREIVIVEYTPMFFGSLFSQTPREEFCLLFDAIKYENPKSTVNNVDDVLIQWGLENIADSNFHELSGGYRKYVFVATQVEARKHGERVVAINIQQQLDVKRFRTIEQKFVEKSVSSVLWVDDDPALLRKKSNVAANKITLTQWL